MIADYGSDKREGQAVLHHYRGTLRAMSSLKDVLLTSDVDDDSVAQYLAQLSPKERDAAVLSLEQLCLRRFAHLLKTRPGDHWALSPQMQQLAISRRGAHERWWAELTKIGADTRCLAQIPDGATQSLEHWTSYISTLVPEGSKHWLYRCRYRDAPMSFELPEPEAQEILRYRSIRDELLEESEEMDAEAFWKTGARCLTQNGLKWLSVWMAKYTHAHTQPITETLANLG